MTITISKNMAINELADYLHVSVESLRSRNNFADENCIPAGTVVYYNDNDITVW